MLGRVFMNTQLQAQFHWKTDKVPLWMTEVGACLTCPPFKDLDYSVACLVLIVKDAYRGEITLRYRSSLGLSRILCN